MRCSAASQGTSLCDTRLASDRWYMAAPYVPRNARYGNLLEYETALSLKFPCPMAVLARQFWLDKGALQVEHRIPQRKTIGGDLRSHGRESVVATASKLDATINSRHENRSTTYSTAACRSSSSSAMVPPRWVPPLPPWPRKENRRR